MKHFDNANLETSFDLPERLTIGELDRYQREMWKAREAYGDKTTIALYSGIVFGAAIEAGLIRNWVSAIMPKLDFETVEQVDASVATWAGNVIDSWMEQLITVPKVTFMQRLTSALHRKMLVLLRG